jgi:hypothetical protein
MFWGATGRGPFLGLLSLLETAGWDLFTKALLRMSSFLLGLFEIVNLSLGDTFFSSSARRVLKCKLSLANLHSSCLLSAMIWVCSESLALNAATVDSIFTLNVQNRSSIDRQSASRDLKGVELSIVWAKDTLTLPFRGNTP